MNRLTCIAFLVLNAGCFGNGSVSSTTPDVDPSPAQTPPASSAAPAPPTPPAPPFAGVPKPPPAGCPTDIGQPGWIRNLSIVANLPAGMGLTIDDGKTLQIGPPPRVGPKLDIAPGTYFVSMIDANGVGVGDSTAIEIPASRWFDDGEIVCRSNVGGVARLTCVVHTGSRTHGSTLHDGVYEITPDAGDATGAAEVAFTADGAANVELRQGASQVLNAPPGDATRHDLPAGDFLAGISFVGEITVTTVVHVPRDARFELASLACRRASAFTAVCSLTSADRALAAVPIDGVVKLCR